MKEIRRLYQLVMVFGIVFRTTVDPAKFGVTLAYALSTATSACEDGQADDRHAAAGHRES